MLTSLFLGLSACAVPAAGGGRAPLDQRELRAALQAELDRQGLPGASVALIDHGEVVFSTGLGFANLEHRVPATAQTIYQSGSAGKQFTAALVMLLAQDGRLALDDHVAQHLPGTPPAWQDITVRHLLTHTSGLADPYEKLDLTRDRSDAELLAIDAEIPLLFSPGTGWSYSNMGYHVLGFLCSHVGGRFYGDQLVERVFRPAGMATARVIDERALVPHRAAGYERDEHGLRNQSWVAPNLNRTGDGSIYLSVLDFAAWTLALEQGTVLSPAAQATMRRACGLADGSTRPYGFGWSLEPFSGPDGPRPAISHGGAWQGFTSDWTWLVDDRLAVVVLTNQAGADPAALSAIALRHALRPAPSNGR